MRLAFRTAVRPNGRPLCPMHLGGFPQTGTCFRQWPVAAPTRRFPICAARIPELRVGAQWAPALPYAPGRLSRPAILFRGPVAAPTRKPNLCGFAFLCRRRGRPMGARSGLCVSGGFPQTGNFIFFALRPVAAPTRSASICAARIPELPQGRHWAPALLLYTLGGFPQTGNFIFGGRPVTAPTRRFNLWLRFPVPP